MKAIEYPKKNYNKEIMKEYSLNQLKLSGKINLCLGEIVSLKALAIRKGFNELAAKLRKEEIRILKSKK